jgi:hypothetical protein
MTELEVTVNYYVTSFIFRIDGREFSLQRQLGDVCLRERTWGFAPGLVLRPWQWRALLEAVRSVVSDETDDLNDEPQRSQDWDLESPWSEPAVPPSRSPRPARVGQPWTPEDERALTESWERKDPISAIAASVERTPGAVRARLVKLGLLLDPYNPGVTLPSADPIEPVDAVTP